MEDAKAFWEACHRANATANLSGVQYDNAVDFLHLRERIRPGIKVLEVGVGLGYVTKALYERKAAVSAVDISDTAIDRVREFCDNTYTINDIDRLPSSYFDVILCINVVQHVPTELLRHEMFHFLRSLRPNGVFALQFVSSDSSEDLGAAATIQGIKAGTLCRSSRFMKALIAELGGIHNSVYACRVLNRGKVNGNHVFHIRKQKCEKS